MSSRVERERCDETDVERTGRLPARQAALTLAGAAETTFGRLVALALIVSLTAMLIVKGVAPPLQRVDTDFPNYLTAAKIVANGEDTARLYDDSWFQARMRAYGMSSYGKFGPFPPPTALLLLPLARLAPLDALRVMTFVSVLCLGASILLLARVLSWSLAASALFVLASYHAIVNDLRDGQPYIVISMCCILGYLAWQRNRRLVAGLCFGFFVPLKYYPVIYLISPGSLREWRVLLGGAIAIGVVAAASIAVLGWPVHGIFLASVIERHLTGHLNPPDPLGLSAAYQSFDSLFGRLFVLDPAANPKPMVVAPVLRPIFVAAAKSALVLATAAVLWRAYRAATAEFTAATVGLLGILVMAIAPATATYHFVLLWLPAGLIADWLRSRRAEPEAYLVLGAYALIGLFPYALTSSFEGRGVWNLLAYPRLWLVIVMWAVCVRALARAERRPVAEREEGARA